MRQEQERFRSFDRGGAPDGTSLGVDTNPPRGWNPIDTSGVRGSVEFSSSRERRLQVTRFNIGQEDSNGEREKEILQEQKTDDFEPFLNQEFKEEDLFVNNYGGNHAQKMELNRKGVERALKTAHLEGKVFLTTLAPSRSRAEAQGNELAAKRFLLFERKTQKAEEENPYKRVVSIPEGWRIEINDTRITEELTERKLTGEKLQRVFINRFNSQLREGLKECVWREKFSSEKDDRFRRKLFLSGFYIAYPSILFINQMVTNPSVFIPLDLGCIFMNNSFVNIMGNLSERRRERMVKTIAPNFNLPKPHSARNIDHPLEYLAPLVEIDKIARTFAYLAGKGRRLVRENKE